MSPAFAADFMEVATVMQDVIGRTGGLGRVVDIMIPVHRAGNRVLLGYDPRVNEVTLRDGVVGSIPDIVGVPNDIAQAVIACFRFAHESGFDLGGAIVEQLRHDEQVAEARTS